MLTVDDHPMLREGIASAIRREPDMEVVGEADNGRLALEAFRRLQPDITLMDLQMPEMGGVDAIIAIRAEFPTAKIIVLTTYAGDVQARRALKGGACGYILKSALGEDLVDTIRAVEAGRRHIAPDIAEEIAIHAGAETLSDRELEVLREVSTGKSNKELARTLGISEDTVKAHLKSIFGKLNVRDRTEAVTVAARRGVLAFWR
ncbi:MAG: response regulator transcription factor [Caulobacteraceae bacterium]